jgi:nitrogen fixation/metabolism regulation signal transduction histidine kinase
MNYNKTTYTVLIGAILLLLFAWLLWWFNGSKPKVNNYASYANTIQDNIRSAIANTQVDQNTLLAKIQENESWNVSSLISDYEYPLACYKNSELSFWSDHRFIPDQIGTNTNRYHYLIHTTGIYLLVRRDFLVRKDTISLVSALLLKKSYTIQNNYLESGFNSDFFAWQAIEINNFQTSSSFEIKSEDGVYLFSIDFDDLPQGIDWTTRLSVTLIGIAGFALLILFLYLVVILVQKQGHHGLSILLLFTMLLSVRGLLLIGDIPFLITELELFDPRYFASSTLAPSLGDFFINALMTAFFAWFLLRNYASVGWVKKVFHKTGYFRFAAIYVCGALLFIASGYALNLFEVLYSSSQYSLDITRNIDLNLFKLVGLLSFVLICTSFFIFNHIFFRVFILLLKGIEKLRFLVLFTLISGFFINILLWGNDWILYVSQLVFFFILFYFRIPYHLSRLNYFTYIYFLLIAFYASFLAAHGLYSQTKSKVIAEKQKYATQLLSENDHFGEYLLFEASKRIAEDKFLISRFKNPFLSKEVIVQKIKKRHLPDYLNKYEPVISLYDEEGNAYINHGEYSTYSQAISLFQRDNYKTEYKGIYFLNEKGESPLKRYVSLIEVYDGGYLTGYVVIELTHKKNTSNSVYPELLVDKKFIQPTVNKEFQYAIFKDKDILVSSGSFNYYKYFTAANLKDKDLYEKGIELKGYHHIGLKTENGKTIVISSPAYYISYAFSNFSFLLVVLVFFVLLFLILNSYYFRSKGVYLNYSTKIQLFLNIAFFLPLILVSVVMLTLIGSGYREALTLSFLNKAENLSANINSHLEEFTEDSLLLSKLEDEVSQLARSTDTDINLYSAEGNLIYSYHPAIYSGELLSQKINSQAYANLVEQNFNEVLLNESVGKLKYNAVYMVVRSFNSGQLLGIVSIPFFEAKQEFEAQLIGILTTILNIFATIFILFLLMAWLASNVLTAPLKILTQKIKKTTFGGNQLLDWKTRDEIGLLVSEYNSMLQKLEASKEALSKSEKESAWREMAKQVAHEIKNPLTPMKLTIQHLQRGWKEKADSMEEKTVKSLGSLLDQVNILSEIASSFSAFAKMPIPKSERIEVGDILRSTVLLYNNNNDQHVVLKVDPDTKYPCMGDGQLLSAIFTNLIINAIQSVPVDKTPLVHIEVRASGDLVHIAISDNGVGISESIRDKVFLPNFSTKDTGSGIGLAVAKRGIEHAGGRIWFETKLLEGTTFYIELPLIKL